MVCLGRLVTRAKIGLSKVWPSVALAVKPAGHLTETMPGGLAGAGLRNPVVGAMVTEVEAGRAGVRGGKVGESMGK